MAIWKRPKSKIIHSRFMFKGKQFTKSLYTTDEAEARRLDAKLVTEALARLRAGQPAFVVETSHLTHKKLCQFDLERAAPRSKYARYTDTWIPSTWDKIGEHFKSFHNITDEQIEAWAVVMQETLSNQTIKKRMATLIRGLRRARKRGFDVNVPEAFHLDPSPISAKSRPTFTTKQIMLFFAHLKNNPPAYDIALIALSTGLRWGALPRLGPQYLSEPEEPIEGIAGMLRLPAANNMRKKTPELVALTPDVFHAIQRQTGERFHNACAFRTASRKAGLPYTVTLRALRRLFASAASSCGSAYSVDLAMGHTGQGARLPYQIIEEQRMASLALHVALKYPVHTVNVIRCDWYNNRYNTFG